MDCKSLNKIQRDKMNAITKNAFEMEWENPEFMDILMGELPKVRHSQGDDDILAEINQLKKELLSYDAFSSNKEEFISKISNCIDTIHTKKEYWFGLSLHKVKECVHQHEFCMISGEGGIGKSYFIKCFEERLENKNIPHLCIYGKFEKDISNINAEEIINEYKSGFVFIVDAVNEMSEIGQEELLKLLIELKKYSSIRIVITYRTNTIESNLLERYKEIAKAEYRFPGVSFESALSEMLKLSVPDIYKYEDILYSNNPLFLNMLCNVLSSEKLMEETVSGIASVTFILEKYIKKSISRAFKRNDSFQGIDIWEDTKRIAHWMYEHGEKSIDEDSLFSVIKSGTHYTSVMEQMELLGNYEANAVCYYSFSIDSLTDFLIARSLFEDIKDKTVEEQVSIIKDKVDSLYGIEEAVIIAIFDKMSPTYTQIMEILQSAGLMTSFQYDTLVKIRFKKEWINSFLENFNPTRPEELLVAMGGYTDKPFNCSNYLFNYYIGNNEKSAELSKILSGFYFLDGIKNRLKNILYFVTLNNRSDRRDDEAYYFALLCSAAPNKDVRCLAMKLLYEIVSNKSKYQSRIMEEYDDIRDFYIKEAIIYVLSQLTKEDDEIKQFFEKLIKEEEDLSAKSIKRIATYLGDEYGYIWWDRKNLFTNDDKAIISDYIDDILHNVDLMNKNFLNFRYWSKTHIDMHRRFLINDKGIISDINNYLEEKYHCVREGECSGLMTFKHKVISEINPMADIETLDMNSFMASYEKVLKRVFEFYDIFTNKEKIDLRQEDFRNSTYMKCVDVATGLYYGSLMCNYYTNQFATYNGLQNNIGYEVYDPLEFGEDIVITSPIPIYQDFIERLGECLINVIKIPAIKDSTWVKNVQLTRDNVLALLQPIEYKNQEWVMLASRISIQREEKHDTKWRDNYNVWCCTSENETIEDNDNARYLTIELDEYLGNIREYSKYESKPWLCKSVNNIYGQSDVFEEISLVLPPAELIEYFKLELNVSDFSWETSGKVKVVVCNNNKNSYYKDPVGSTVFIRKDYLDEYLKNNTIKYFAFTERFIPETGYADETSLHFEILNGCIKKEILNYRINNSWHPTVNPLCENCPHGHFVDYIQETPTFVDNIVKPY